MLRLAPYIQGIRTRFCRLKSVHRSMWRNSFQTKLKMLSAVFDSKVKRAKIRSFAQKDSNKEDDII